jgi:hypothetical protein
MRPGIATLQTKHLRKGLNFSLPGFETISGFRSPKGEENQSPRQI